MTAQSRPNPRTSCARPTAFAHTTIFIRHSRASGNPESRRLPRRAGKACHEPFDGAQESPDEGRSVPTRCKLPTPLEQVTEQ